ncbi:early endosome antigen 1-like [Hydractinia symbiolongicarpus]|uniref:early endosome antigen 1-like n=1 Tax=Hydractinia symbiolongicarpus TaxID=13093 RepID=UPI00254CD322|nr:early endosome antigen 1-like [Hydractinia symbiolongicarpus]
MLASKPKKKSKVDPTQTATELNELGLPPSTSDLAELFEADSEGTGRANSSFVAFTEETGLGDSRANSQAQSTSQKEGDDASSRSSTPSSSSGLKRLKRNVVTPIHEETSFGVDNKNFEKDNTIPKAWENSDNEVSNRPGTAPSYESPRGKLETPRPQTAPQGSPRLTARSNKVSPVSSRSSTPVEKIHTESEVPKTEYVAQLDDTAEKKLEDTTRPMTAESIKSSGSRKGSRKEKMSVSTRKNSWTIHEVEEENDEKADVPEKSVEASDDKKSLVSIDAEAVLAPPVSSGDQEAYIPVEQAKACIQRVIEDMKKMKANHYAVVEKIQEQYQLIEEESQAQFNAYVIKLRGEYNTKVSTFRHVLESHQTEFTNKQKFYEEAIRSLRDKNRQLLIEKRQMLLKAKDSNASHEQEKNTIVTDLTGMLDQKHKDHVLLHSKYIEEKSSKEESQKENIDLKNEINNLKSRLELSSGESQKVFEELDTLKNENEELKSKLEEVRNEKEVVTEEKGKLEEQCNEKSSTLEEKEQQLESKIKTIEKLELKIKELDEREPVVVASAPVVQETVATSEEVQLLNQPVVVTDSNVSNEELLELKNKVNEYEEEKEKLLKEMKEIRDEKNIVKMELINLQERNKILHRRLETMLNEVTDSVNIDNTQTKLSELQERKTVLQTEADEINKKIEEWKENYRSENNGEEPSDGDYPDDIKDFLEQLKTKNENISNIDKDIIVLSMLLDGTLPDDMKQESNAEQLLDSATDQLKQQFAEEKNKLCTEIEKLKAENDTLRQRIEELEAREPEKIVETVTTTVPVVATAEVSENSSADVAELTAALSETNTRIQELETEHAAELESQKKQAHKTDKKLNKLQSAYDKLEAEKRDLESQLKVAKETAEAELKQKDENLEKAKKEIDELNEAKISKLPVKAKTEIKALQEKLKQAEGEKDGRNQEVLDLKSQISKLNEDVTNLNITIKALKEKEAELLKLQETDKKYKELKKRYKALEAKKTVTKTIPQQIAAAAGDGEDPQQIKKLKDKIAELEKQIEEGAGAAAPAVSKKDSKVDSKALSKLEKSNETLKEKVENMKKAAQTDADKIKELQEKIKEAKTKGDEKAGKKQEKAMKDLQKKFESEQKKTAKLKEDLEKTKEESTNLKKEVDELTADVKRDKDEIAKLSVAAKEGIEAAEKVADLSKSNKELTEENKTLAENFNSERILRKKYYNMVEDMKGKIRVYARARPLSRSELERGNHNIVSSPDEYSLVIQTNRGPKDFQYDAVFTPDLSQEKVFEDTNNLIQSAVDGYNVCIFAYGQTGSGKTYTMIGDKEQKSPGIAPRAFKAIYELIEENKKKFSFTTQMYMMELYRDNLIDLFGNKKDPARLDIKKDKKGMVVVSGAVIRDATNAEELMQIFEEGSSSRHIASTKMNSESSRSHLILSIIIESTNLTSGAVVKGKLSLVDLAGSERAAKTGATPEQLKEAQSINKSLSALGDVISALSSEQSFIPYRNNKLTLLMQDSLGGNAKTLMFVNISPADYNADETVTSLTYASRVKLITNDASKNSDNKEIARLKGIISKLKKGEKVDDEDE